LNILITFMIEKYLKLSCLKIPASITPIIETAGGIIKVIINVVTICQHLYSTKPVSECIP
jgi:hypothetical protein